MDKQKVNENKGNWIGNKILIDYLNLNQFMWKVTDKHPRFGFEW